MSLRSDVENALIEVDRRYFQLTQSEFVSAATDAALVVVRSHVNQIADELYALASPEMNDSIDDGLSETTRAILRFAARRVRSICEEQTEDRASEPVDCPWCDGSGWRDDMGVHCNHSIHREAKP